MRRLFLLLGCVAALSASMPETRTISVLATTDVHGNIYPVDYYTDRAAPRGLARIATLVRAARTDNPASLLIDCGDSIEGSPLEYSYQAMVRDGHPPLGLPAAPELKADPMMLVMNRMGYAAMTVGNHEFNFGLRNLNRAREEARFPWLAANVTVAPEGAERPFAPYIVQTVGGVKVAVIGFTTPAVPTWEKPENLGGYRFGNPREAVARAVAELRRTQQPDVILVAAHAGLGRDLRTGAERDAEENGVYDVASHVTGIDAIIYGHSHQQLEHAEVAGILLVQPKNWGMSLARLDFTMARQPGGRWRVVQKTSRLIQVTDRTAADPEILALARPYHEFAERYLNTPVATAGRELDGSLGRIEDTALVDAIQTVQLYYGQADVSFTALFNPRVRVLRGPVTARQIAALYIYDNQLYTIEGTGRMIKAALENAARYFRSCADASCAEGPLTNPRVIGFNYDMAKGVDYEIDLGHPEGDRIRNLRWNGKPLAPEQKLLVALNNYRAAGSAGYSMFVGARVVRRSTEDIRDLIVRYYTERKRLPEEPDHNWRILPDEAVRTLERQASEEAKRVNLF